MENFPINPADAAVLGILLLAALLAFTRGLVAEVLSVASWAGAALITLYAMPTALPLVQSKISHETIAYVVTGAALFVVSLVVLTLLSRALSRSVQNSGLSALDRSLGFLFGIFKGAILVSVAYLSFLWLVPNIDEHPRWLRDAKSQPLLTSGAATIMELVPESLRQDGLDRVDLAREQARRAMEAKEALDRLSTPVPSPANRGDAAPANTGYNNRERADFERLIQNQSGQ